MTLLLEEDYIKMNNNLSTFFEEETKEIIKQIISYFKDPPIESVSEETVNKFRAHNDMLSQLIRKLQLLDSLKTTIDNKKLMVEIEDLLESLKQK